jgi:hypothetical protein
MKTSLMCFTSGAKVLQISTLTLLLNSGSLFAEVFKWTDDEGKVHYGQSLPPEYAEQGERVQESPINTIAPEPEIKRQNKNAVQKLKTQDAARKTRDSQMRRDSEASSSESRISLEEARAACRDAHVLVKARTECFKQAAENH